MINFKLKNELTPEFYNDLVKYGFIEDAEDIVYSPAIININIEDLKSLEKGEIVGIISQTFSDLNEDYNVLITNKCEPNSCIFHISSNENVKLEDVNILLDKLRNKFNLENIIFGTSVSNIKDGHYKVRALLMKM